MKKILFISTSIIIAALLVIFFLSSFTRNQPATESIPLPTIAPLPTLPFVTLPPENDVSFFDKTQLIQQLPIETNAYNIEYLVESDTFVVTIKESPYLQNKNTADQFFIRNGATDLSKLRIIYNSYRWVQ